VELITALKKLGELDQLRHARKLGTTDEDKEKTELLFKRATQDYLSMIYISLIYKN